MPGTALVPQPHCAGWYGKIPSLGDFASRRLPQAFIAEWDKWLQHGLAASRAHLGERWLDLYLTSPIWRFALMPGACGEQAWAGLLMPSVDKVGRYFPLTLAVPLEPDAETAPTIFSAQTWFAALEALALSALAIGTSADDLERGLAGAPFPMPGLLAPPQCSNAKELARWWQHASAPSHSLQLPSAASLAELMTATAQGVFAETGFGKSVWWAVAEETRITQLHCFSGLPPADRFAALLTL